MKIVHMSDNHGIIPKDVEECDILVHSGDVTNIGELSQVFNFITWISRQKARFILFIGGNHDRSFDEVFMREHGRKNIYEDFREILKGLPSNAYYLENEDIIIDGVKFWGSPVTPDFFPESWAFNKTRGKIITEVWEKIPKDTDVIITHGPPYGILDKCIDYSRVGCKDLLKKVELIKPKLHLFGHIHEAYGVIQKNETTFSNSSILNERYKLVNEPQLFII